MRFLNKSARGEDEGRKVAKSGARSAKDKATRVKKNQSNVSDSATEQEEQERAAAAMAKLQAFGAQFMASLGLDEDASDDASAEVASEQSSTVDGEDDSASSDDDSDDSDSSEDEQHDPKHGQTATAQASVVVFEDPTARQSVKSSKRDYRAFMSSKVEKIAGEAPVPTKKPRNKREQEEEIEDRINDQALNDLLKSANLVERIATENLQGKDRRKYLTDKLVDLGAKPLKQKGRMPFNMHMGIQNSRKEKVEKKLEEARNLGMYRRSMRRELEDEMGVMRKKENGLRKDRGLKMATGRYRDGALHISEQDIKRINREGRQSGRGGRGRGGKRKGKR